MSLSRGIAASSALAPPLPCVPGATVVNLGTAYYNSQTAIAATAARWTASGTTNINVGVAYGGTGNSVIVRGGIGFVFK